MHPTFAAPRRARGARRARAMTRESPATASTSARAFLRGGAFERAVATRSWPFLGLFAARDDDDVAKVETVARASLDGRVAYDKAALLRLRDAAASSGTPPGATEEDMRAYPWRARVDVGQGASEVENDAEEDAVTAAATARVVMETEAVARARSAWRERETFEADAEQAAVALRRVLARESEGDGDAVSEGYRVTFRDGAVRAFVRKLTRERFGDLSAADLDLRETSREGETAVLYGTRRLAEDGAYEVSVAFVHPWDGELEHVVSWLSKPADDSETVVSPVGWLRANASLGASLPPNAKRAYDDIATGRGDAHVNVSAARLFVALDVSTSACGPLVMECYDLESRAGVEYFLGGADAAEHDEDY